MKYKPEWRGRVKVSQRRGEVWIDGELAGTIVPRYKRGTVTPKGTRTDEVFTVDGREFLTMFEALEHIVERSKEGNHAVEPGR